MIFRMRLRKAVRIVPVLAFALAAAGAAGAETPGYLSINHQRIVAASTGDVWTRLHDFLRDEGFAVTAESYAGGSIDAVRATPGKAGFGRFAICAPRLFWRTAQARLELTILLAPQPDGTRVKADAAFLDVGHPNRRGRPSFTCTSTGVLETAVLDVAGGQPMEAAVIPR